MPLLASASSLLHVYTVAKQMDIIDLPHTLQCH